MTQVEILIRNIADTARKQIVAQRDRELAEIERDIPMTDCPPQVQEAVTFLRSMAPKLAKARKTIQKYGYAPPELDLDDHCACPAPATITVSYEIRKLREHTIRKSADKRLNRLATIQHQTSVSTLGKAAAEAKGTLEVFRRNAEELTT